MRIGIGVGLARNTGAVAPFDSGLITNGGFEDGSTGWRGYLDDPTNLDGVTFGETPTNINAGKVARIFHAVNPSDIEGFEQAVDVSAVSAVSLSGEIDYLSGVANMRVVVTGTGFTTVQADYIGVSLHDLSATASLQNMDVSGASEIVVAFRMRANGDINAEIGKLRLTGS